MSSPPPREIFIPNPSREFVDRVLVEDTHVIFAYARDPLPPGVKVDVLGWPPRDLGMGFQLVVLTEPEYRR